MILKVFDRFLISVLLLSLLGCFGKEDDLKNETVLKVANESLTLHQFSTELARRMRDQPLVLAKDPKLVKKMKDQVLRDFIVYALSKDWAQANGLGLSETELDQKISEVRETYPNDLAFREALAAENVSFSQWRDRLARTLLTKKVFEKVASTVANPTQEELALQYQESKKDLGRPARILIRQIVVDKKIIAQEIEKRLNSSNFAEMAKKYSIGPEGVDGGLVGWIEKGTLEVFDKAFAVKPGRVSEVLESPYGFHIIRVEKIEEAGFQSLTEALPEIREKLLLGREQSAFSSWLDERISGTKVWRNEALIEATQLEYKD